MSKVRVSTLFSPECLQMLVKKGENVGKLERKNVGREDWKSQGHCGPVP